MWALVITIAIADNQEPVLVSETGSEEESTFLSNAKQVETIGLMPTANRNGRITGLRTNLRLRLPRGRAALFIGLALLIVFGSLGFFYFRYYNLISRISLLNAGLSDPYTSGGTLALNDPLSDNSNGYFWTEGNDSHGTCEFTGGAYHVSRSDQGGTHYCTAGITNFNNFAFQVQMTIVRGDDGGIIFRGDDTNGNLYFFGIGQDGSYNLIRYDGLNSSGQILKTDSSTAIHIGLNQFNLIAVVANGSSIDLYVNGQNIASVSDSTYSQGQVGVAVYDVSNPTEVVFSNAKVWTF